MSDLRNEQSVSIIYEQISSFCIENSVDLASKQKERRVRNIPSQSQNAFITSTIGHHANMKSEDDCRTNLYYLIIDFLIIIFLFCMKYLLFVLKMMIFFTLNQFNHLPHIWMPIFPNEIQALKSMLKKKKLNNMLLCTLNDVASSSCIDNSSLLDYIFFLNKANFALETIPFISSNNTSPPSSNTCDWMMESIFRELSVDLIEISDEERMIQQQICAYIWSEDPVPLIIFS